MRASGGKLSQPCCPLAAVSGGSLVLHPDEREDSHPVASPAGPATDASPRDRSAHVRIPKARSERLDGDAVILQAESAHVAVLTRRRNGWHSTTVARYDSDDALFTTVAAAQRAAQPLRKQGTVFHVREVPALVLKSVAKALVLVDFHSTNSFMQYRPFVSTADQEIYGLRVAQPYGVGMTMQDVLHNFSDRANHWEYPRPTSDSLVAGRLPLWTALHVVRHNKRLKTYSSHVASCGDLAWSESPSGRSWKGTHGVVRQVHEILMAVPGYVEALEEAMRLEQDLRPAPSPAERVEALRGVLAARRAVAALLLPRIPAALSATAV